MKLLFPSLLLTAMEVKGKWMIPPPPLPAPTHTLLCTTSTVVLIVFKMGKCVRLSPDGKILLALTVHILPIFLFGGHELLNCSLRDSRLRRLHCPTYTCEAGLILWRQNENGSERSMNPNNKIDLKVKCCYSCTVSSDSTVLSLLLETSWLLN